MAKNLFVYGTLMRGEQRHSILEDAKYLGTASLTGAELWDTGCGFPALTLSAEDPEACVWGEVYEITVDATWEALDVLEGGLYDRIALEVQLYGEVLQIAGIQAETYVWKLEREGLRRIPSGSWRDR